MRTGQDFTIGRGEELRVRFVVEGCAGATDAQWYCALSPSTKPSERDLELTTGDGITLADAGEDALVDLAFTAGRSEGLKVGVRHHELWVTVNGESARRAVGHVTVQDTLRA